MKFYIATRIDRKDEHNIIRDLLCGEGHEITYDWTEHGSVKNTTKDILHKVSHSMVSAVSDADFVVLLLPGGRGTHTELGMALALEKRVFLHSPNEEHFIPCEETVAFYHHAAVSQLFSPFDQLPLLLLRELAQLAEERHAFSEEMILQN